MSRRSGPRPLQERLSRLLVMLPWLMERGQAPVAEIAQRFGLTEADVVTDLEQVACCGLPPFIDEFVDLFIDEGIAYVGIPRFFTRPLRLTAPEAFTVLAAARAALALPGADPDGALARAVERLGAVLGDDGIVPEFEVPPETDILRAAAERGEQVRLEYWSPRTGATSRIVTPLIVFTDRGSWYVAAHDHSVDEQRTFRIDRVLSCAPTGIIDPRADAARRAVGHAADDWLAQFADADRVRIELDPAGRWLADQVPAEVVHDDGTTLVIEIAVADEQWLARLALQIGPTGRIVAPAERCGIGGAAAAELLALRYGDRRSADREV